jgi:hypothetical protein
MSHPSAYFVFPSLENITCINSKVIIVEYDQLEDIQVMISIDTRVPLIRHVADRRVRLVHLCTGGENCVSTNGECQVMAITISLWDSSLSSAGGRHNENKNSRISEAGVGELYP